VCDFVCRADSSRRPIDIMRNANATLLAIVPCTDIIPSDPQATHKRYVHDDAMDQTVIGQNNAVPKHISGYSGFVPQIRDAALGETFASHCAKVMGRHMDAKNDRRALNANPVGGFAFSGTTTKPQAKLVVKDVGLNLTYTAQ